MADYKWTLRGVDDKSEAYADLLSTLHTRNAQRLLALAQSSVGGIFIKAGQHICSLKPVVPAEYANVLSVLQDSVAPRPIAEVMRTLEEELGEKRAQIRSIEEKPLGTASLAQVHRAELADGTAVALKVQHAHMQQMVHADLTLLTALARFVDWSFDNIEILWIVEEVSKAVTSEMDFRNELQNSEKCAYNFRYDPTVYVPRVFHPLSTSRVLTMEYINGVKVNDTNEIRKLGLDCHDIAGIVLSMFSAQIFCHGFVHCDPHPGNMLVRVRPNTTGAPQVVLLDHGLYRQFEPGFRERFCDMWLAMLYQNKAQLRKVCAEFKINEVHMAVLPVIFIHRAIDASSNLGERMSDADRKRLLKVFKGTQYDSHFGTVGWFTELLKGIPRDMIFIMRTLNLVRALNLELGGTSRERFFMQSEFAIRGACFHEPPPGPARRMYREGWVDPPRDAWSRLTIGSELFWLRVRLFSLEKLKALRTYLARFLVSSPEPAPPAAHPHDEHWLKR